MTIKTKTSHTPGPWESITGSPRNHGGIVLAAADKSLICTTAASRNNEQGNADARLIAAAPDLLAALQRFARAMEQGRYPEIQGVASDAFAAIAKAEGR